MEYGYRYDEVRDLTTTEIAKRIRADIKVAKSEGLLPKNWKYSVRSRYFSGGSSIDVEVRDCADAWIAQDDSKCVGYDYCHVGPDYSSHLRNCPAAEHLTDDAEAAKMTLERIHNAYNFDDNDIMIDYFHVNYYGIVEVERPDQADYRARSKAAARG